MTILIALATTDEEPRAVTINVGDLHIQGCGNPQTTAVNYGSVWISDGRNVREVSLVSLGVESDQNYHPTSDETARLISDVGACT